MHWLSSGCSSCALYLVSVAGIFRCLYGVRSCTHVTITLCWKADKSRTELSWTEPNRVEVRGGEVSWVVAATHLGLHVKLISFNLNAIWRCFTRCTHSAASVIYKYLYLAGMHMRLYTMYSQSIVSVSHSRWFNVNDAMPRVRRQTVRFILMPFD